MYHSVSFMCTCDYVNLHFVIFDCALVENKLTIATVYISLHTVIWGPFYKHGLKSTLAWINKYIHYKMWNEISYPVSNLNGCTVEVWEWISDFIPHLTVHLITHPDIVAIIYI